MVFIQIHLLSFNSEFRNDSTFPVAYGVHTDPFVEGDVYIKFNESVLFGNADDGDTGIIDWESVSTHEFGHAAGLLHNPSRLSVMYESIAEDHRWPWTHWHDRAVMGDMY